MEANVTSLSGLFPPLPHLAQGTASFQIDSAERARAMREGLEASSPDPWRQLQAVRAILNGRPIER